MTAIRPADVPTYETRADGRAIWAASAAESRPAMAIRDGERGFVVRYDLTHLDRALSEAALRDLRAQLREQQAPKSGVDPISESAGLGGEVGHLAGEVHADTIGRARELAETIGTVVGNPDRWARVSRSED